MMPFAALRLRNTSTPAPVTDPMALVYRTSTASVSANSAIAFDLEAHDSGNWHDNVTNNSRLTVPSGVSLVRAIHQANWSSSTARPVATRKNGSSVAGRGTAQTFNTGGDYQSGASAPLSVSNGDYLEAYNEASSDSPKATYNWFGVETLDSSINYAVVQKSGSGSQTLTANVTTTITFDAELADVGGWHDNTTNNSRLTVPSGVSYVRVSANIQTNASVNSDTRLSFLKNGSSALGLPERDDLVVAIKRLNAVSAILPVSSGDYFEIQVTGSGAETIAQNDAVWFAIEEVSASTKMVLLSKSSAQSFTSGVPAVLTWDTETYDTDGAHDGTNPSRITVPSGCTKARLSFCFQSGGSTSTARVIKNGDGSTNWWGLPAHECSTSGADNMGGLGMWVDVVPGDYFEVEISTGTQNAGNNNQTWFCGEFR